MPQDIVVVATVTPKPGEGEKVRAGLEQLVAATHAEPGCITYALHEASDPQRFFFVEHWADQQALDAHFASPHMAAVGQLAAESLSEPPQITMLSPLGVGPDPKKASV